MLITEDVNMDTDDSQEEHIRVDIEFTVIWCSLNSVEELITELPLLGYKGVIIG